MELVDKIYQSYVDRDLKAPRRDYLGASIIGHKCDRYLWLYFRHAYNPEKDKEWGRILRLFERGRREEPWIYSDLREVGLEVHDVDAGGNQFRFEQFGGHFAGSCDGVVFYKGEWYLLEIKTHGEKSFSYLKEKKLRSAKPEHYAQMQVYMKNFELKKGLYIAICKNTDEIYIEEVAYNEKKALELEGKALNVIQASSPPKRMASSWDGCFECKYCDYQKECHKLDGFTLPEKNCRNCTHSTPKLDGSWFCEKHGKSFSKEFSKIGCEEYVCHPEIVPATPIDLSPEEVVYVDGNGKKIINKKGERVKWSQE